MSVKKRLADIARQSRRHLRELSGHNEAVMKDCHIVVENYCSRVEEQASIGENKYFFDMQDYNQATITKISIELKERLADVLIVVSPRGIEVNWEMQE